MSKFISVTAKQIAADYESATYECVVSRANGGYYGLCNNTKHLVIWKAGEDGKGKPYKHWGFPEYYTTMKWKSSWGWMSSNLKPGNYFTSPFGRLEGTDLSKISWTEKVKIDRGNSRQGTKTVQVGMKASKSVDSRFATTLKTLELKTLEIPKPSDYQIQVTVDGNDVTERYVHIYVYFTNPAQYYTGIVYKEGVEVVRTEEGNYDPKTQTTTLEYTIPITEELYETYQVYTLKIIGKDNTEYFSTDSDKKFVEANINNVHIKTDSGTIEEAISASLLNVSVKPIVEVWVKDDDKVYKL